MQREIITKNVEFYGIPGSGKTTIAKNIIRKIRRHNLNTNILNIELEKENRLKRVFIKMIFIKIYILRHPFLSIKLFLRTLKTKQKSNKDFMTVFANLIFILGLYDVNKTKINVLDQGLIQAIWAIIYSSNNKDNKDLFANLINLSLKTINDEINIIIVNTDSKLAIKRLIQRDSGSNRLYKKVEESDFLKENLSKTDEIIKKILLNNKFNKINIIEIENNISLNDDKINILFQKIFGTIHI